MIRILIADDHAIMRTGIKNILQEALTDVVFGQAWDAESARQTFTQGEWDLIVLDLTMPGVSGLELLKEFRKLRPTIPIIILSFYSEDEYAIRAIRAGAASYLSKAGAISELSTAARQALEGHRYISPSQAERIASELDSSAQSSHAKLSDREYLIMCEIGTGKAMKQIAANLGLSIKTVSTYRARLMKKLQMNTNAEVIRHVVEEHLV